MRRLHTALLLALPLFLFGCTTRDVGPSPAAPRVDDVKAEAEPEPQRELGPELDTTPAPPPPVLTLGESRVGARGTFLVSGKVENAKVPATFHLKSESGCARDAKLRTSTVGIGFSFTLDAAELADTFACAVDIEADGAVLGPIAIAPAAIASHAASGLSLEDSVVAVSASLDPRDGQTVRFTVLSDEALDAARIDLEGASYTATLTENDAVTSNAAGGAIFEIPAATWARAHLAGSVGHVTVTLPGGAQKTIDVTPSVDVSVVSAATDEPGC